MRVLCVALCSMVRRSRPAVACCTVRSSEFHHWIHHLWPLGAVPPGFNLLRRGWVYRPVPEAPRKRGMPTGSEAFLKLPIVFGFGPATGLTLKTAFCHIRTLVGRRINQYDGTEVTELSTKLHNIGYYRFLNICQCSY